MSRTCVPCTACCHVYPVPETGSPAFVDCAHLGAQGCGVHATRPAMCRAFACEWLQGWGGDEDRPDRLGLVFIRWGEETPRRRDPVPGQADRDARSKVRAEEVRPGAADAPAALAALERWRAAGLTPWLVRHGEAP